MLQKYQLHTDGACSGNPGPGGWGAVLLGPNAAARPEKILGEFYGGAVDTTNNRMELTAAIQALRHEPAENRGRPLTIFSDSQYVVHAFTQGWLVKWQRNGWRTAQKQPVKNDELWRQLAELVSARSGPVSWEWVKGHSGDPWNELCDRMAVRAGREVQRIGGSFQEGSGCYAGHNQRPDDPPAAEKIVEALPSTRPEPEPEELICPGLPCLRCGSRLQGQAKPVVQQPYAEQPTLPRPAGEPAKQTWIVICIDCGEILALSLESLAAESLTRQELAAVMPWE